MNRLKSLFSIFLAGVAGTALTGCTDDDLGFSDSIRDGETVVSLEASFSPFAEGDLTRASNTFPAESFNTLSDLVVLVYDMQGNLMKDENGDYLINDIKFSAGDLKDEDRTDADASNGHKAEDKTLSLKNLSLRVPFGEYYIIGVANIGGNYSSTRPSDPDVSSPSYLALTGSGKYAEEAKTLEGLRRAKIGWDIGNYANNRAMLGYFAEPSAPTPRSNNTFASVKVNRPGMNLRAWLRRCASKITIDFDGSELRENVYIYIKDAKIYDLAKDCTLGFGNPQTTSEGVADYNNSVKSEDDLIQRDTEGNVYSGNCIMYGEGESFGAWPCITKGSPYIMDGSQKKDLHTQTSDALYFYENMQGNGPDRTPVPDLANGGVSNNNIKDGKDYGTYIEVTAHYKSNADGNIAEYDVKYRFMLGQNVTTNYDAERNHHYKLTLKFRGNANEYHWHIDYQEASGFNVPNPWYVSYLYNHDAYLPFKYIPPKGYEVTDMTAEIITNPWYPSDIAEPNLTDPDVEIKAAVPAGDEPAPYISGDNKYNCNGFLSLREPNEFGIITDIDAGKPWNGNSYNDMSNKIINQDYYEGKRDNIVRYRRDLIKDGLFIADTDSEKEREHAKYTKDGDTYSIDIPLFTRAKVMVKQTGYSGNNPFVGYQRVARVRFKVTLRNKDNHSLTMEDQADVNVVQVRRVVNPKGVYRSAGNSAPFHVKMMFLESDAPNASFSAIKSRGPWTAEVIGDKNAITLDGKQTASGPTGSEIDFNINFNRISSGNRNAVIRIKYHNYTCTHLIFVRQGYAPQAISGSGKNLDSDNATATKWNTFNMIAEGVMATDPRDEGSLFKFGNSSKPIDAINNVYKDGSGNEIYYNLANVSDFKPHDSFKAINEKGELLPESDNFSWTDVEADDNGFSSGEIANAATMRDFEQLYLTPNVMFGYGVLYADGASETKSTIEEAYGYSRYGDQSRGMRGMFAYYWDGKLTGGSEYNAKNIFFPIGRSGYGHRKNAKEEIYSGGSITGNQNGKGILRYAAQRSGPASEYKAPYNNFQHIAPLFESLYRRPGAIYWARNKAAHFLESNGTEWNNEPGKGGIAYGLDINYFSFDVNSITHNNIDSGNDACFVRTVKK